MTPDQLDQIEGRLSSFLDECFAGLGRQERVSALRAYLRGLLLDGERKSIAPIAKRMASARAGAEGLRQRLQQAVVVAKWDEGVVYRRLAEEAEKALPGIDALVIDDTGFPKKGRHSVGVQRQYSGTLGRIDNCQVATSLHMASEHGGVCLGLQLYLPKQWAEDKARRDKAGVPKDRVFQKKWENALALLDRALTWSIKRRPIVGDAEFGNNTEFRSALEVRNLQYVMNVSAQTVAWPPGAIPKPPRRVKKGPGRPRTRWTAPKKPRSVQQIAEQLPSSAWRTVTWRNGSRGPQRGRFAAVRIHTAHHHTSGHPPSDEMWLLCEWPKRAKRPTTFWLSNLPRATSKKRLVYLAKLRWRIERDYQEMKGQLGLDHFEGRTWAGFHHHAACVAAAHAFLSLDRVRFPPQPQTVTADVSTRPSASAPQNDWPLPHVQSADHSPRAAQNSPADVIR